MDNEIKISVLVPVYGTERYIERCGRSLLEQTMSEGVEFIFVNDGSRDSSIEILIKLLEQYPRRAGQVKILHHEVNRGIGATRKTCLEAANGKYLLFCDSDDYFEADMLLQMYLTAERTDADVVIADYYNTSPETEELIHVEIHDSQLERMRSLISYSESSVGYMLWNKLVKKSVLANIPDLFNEGFDYNEDLVAVSKILMVTSAVEKVKGAFTHYITYNKLSISKTFTSSMILSHFRANEELSRYEGVLGVEYRRSLDVKRFRDKLTGLIHSEGELQNYCLSLYPNLNFGQLKRNIPIYWRIPYRLALRGRIREFNWIKKMLLMIKSSILRVLN